MNNTRRKQIEKQAVAFEKIVNEIEQKAADEELGKNDVDYDKIVSHWQKQLEDIQSAVEELCTEEDDFRENMPDSLQDSDKYSDSEAASEAMTEAYVEIELLASCEIEDFNEFFHEKQEEIITKLYEAAE